MDQPAARGRGVARARAGSGSGRGLRHEPARPAPRSPQRRGREPDRGERRPRRGSPRRSTGPIASPRYSGSETRLMRLAAPPVGREVGRGRDGRDEEERLADAEHGPGQNEQPRLPAARWSEQRQDRQRRPEEERRAPEPIGDPADDGPERERRDAEDRRSRSRPRSFGSRAAARRTAARRGRPRSRERRRTPASRRTAPANVGGDEANGGAAIRRSSRRAPRCSARRPRSSSAAAYGSSRWRGDLADSVRGGRRGPGATRAGRAAARRRSPRPAPPPARAGHASVGRPRPRARWRSRAASSSGTPSPVAAVVIRTSGRFGRGRSLRGRRAAGPTVGDEHRPELGRRPLGAGLVALVHDDEVGHLEQARLDRLDLVAHLGRLEDDRRVGGGRDLDLALAGPDRLDEDEVEPGRVEDGRRGARSSRRDRRRGRGPPSSG